MINKMITSAVIASGVAIAGFDIISTIRHERAKRREIEHQSDAQLDAIHHAEAEVKMMIDEGLYNGKDVQMLLRDFDDLIKLENER